jgi:hypothetical protein
MKKQSTAHQTPKKPTPLEEAVELLLAASRGIKYANEASEDQRPACAEATLGLTQVLIDSAIRRLVQHAAVP